MAAGLVKMLLLLVLGVWALLAVVAWLLADRLIFLPPRASYSEHDLPIEFVTTADDARLATLHLPAPPDAFTILFSHGNAEDLGQLRPFLAWLHGAGFGVLAWDYRGYGASTGGPPGAAAVERDIATLHRHAVERLGIPPERLLVHGRSVGTGPALALAGATPVAGVIIESGFTSAFRVVTRVSILPFDRFPNLRRVRAVQAPVLVIHGTRDEVIPFRHGQLLFDAAPGEKQMFAVEGAGHNDLVIVAGERYLEALREFAEVARRGSSPEPRAATDLRSSR
jgi:abhydrolase domain-containing protein 17